MATETNGVKPETNGVKPETARDDEVASPIDPKKDVEGVSPMGPQDKVCTVYYSLLSNFTDIFNSR
jgi:hypothetical protein